VSVRGRLLGVVTGLTVLTLGGAFVAVSVAVNRDQERQLDAALVREADEEAREVATLTGDHLAISDRPGPQANDVGPLTKYAAVYGADGAPRVATETFHGRPPPFATVRHPDGMPFDLDGPGEHLRGVLVGVPGRPGVKLLLAAPRTDLDGDAVFLRRAMVLVFCVALGWSVAIASWFVRRLTRDYELVAAVTRRVAGGDLSARVSDRSDDREVAQFERDLDGMIDRLALLVSAQQRFIAHAAHELRSPLTVLLGEITLTLRRERDAPEYRAALEEALTAAERMRDLADGLLTLARMGAAEPSPRESVALADVVRAAVDEVSVQAEVRGVALRVDAEPAAVDGHAMDLQRLVRNLVENAVRHARQRVSVTCARRGGRAEVAVEDDGPGVAPHERERIFEAFHRGEAERAADGQGAGLGLAIVREIARRHGGEVTLDASGALGGARFVVGLPLRPRDAGR